MRQWGVLYRKEMLELWRSSKWLWVPIVFVLLGMMNPITSYYLPDILKSAGGLPEGAVIEIPVPSGEEVMAQTLSQYSTMGVLILVLVFMGIVSAERNSGAAHMILVKPVRYASYISAKWASSVTLTAVSFLLGYAAAWYYTSMLIGPVGWGELAASWALYLLWLVFVLSMTLLFSVCLKGGGANAFLTLLCTAGLSMLSSLFPSYMAWSPARLSEQAGALLLNGDGRVQGVAAPLLVSVLIVACLLYLSVLVLKKQEAAA